MPKRPTEIQDTGGIPVRRNVAGQSTTFWTRIEISVTVVGVEYLRPRREQIKAAAELMEVTKASACGDINMGWKVAQKAWVGMETVLQFRSCFESFTEQNCLVVNQLLIRSP